MVVIGYVIGPQQSSVMTAGVASDALKVAEYRSALRLRAQMLQAGAWSSKGDEVAYKNFSRILSKACDLSPIKSPQIWQMCSMGISAPWPSRPIAGSSSDLHLQAWRGTSMVQHLPVMTAGVTEWEHPAIQLFRRVMVHALSQAYRADPRAHLGPGCEDLPSRLQQLEQQGLPAAAGPRSLELQVLPAEATPCLFRIHRQCGSSLSCQQPSSERWPLR